ncbi:MAG: hypothetical protein ACK5JS_02730 [Mangrovibacterium sp.]
MTYEYENGVMDEQPLKESYIAGYVDYNINPKVTFNINEKLNLETRVGYFFKERNLGDIDGRKVRDRFYDRTVGLKADYTFSDKEHLQLSFNYDVYDKYDFYKLLDEGEYNYANKQIRAGAIYDNMIIGKHLLVIGV